MFKWCHYVEDTERYDMELRYFRDTDAREVDFVVLRERKPELFVECKLKDKNISKHLSYLRAKFPHVCSIQVVADDFEAFVNPAAVEVLPAVIFLKTLV